VKHPTNSFCRLVKIADDMASVTTGVLAMAVLSKFLSSGHYLLMV
jgi:hypothetical protein